jgi:uncharacterized coiled-coil protein SlyX
VDKKFMEFWGNFLINAARSQQQAEDMAKWIAQGFDGFDALTKLFRSCYGMDQLDEGSAEYVKIMEQAQAAFWESFQSYLSLFGVVPKEEHLALVKRYEELKEKIAAHEETIKHLRMLLDEKLFDQNAVVKGLQDLVKEQTDRFQELMTSSAQFLKKESRPKKNK